MDCHARQLCHRYGTGRSSTGGQRPVVCKYDYDGSLPKEFRFVDESLVINDRSDLGPVRGTNTVLDVARTRNCYYGTQVGFSSLFLNSKGWSLEVQTKFGIGSVRQEVQIFGQNTFGDLPVENTGLYAGSFNSGRFARNQFGSAVWSGPPRLSMAP